MEIFPFHKEKYVKFWNFQVSENFQYKNFGQI